ncbi:WhiB family transcriptional regulator [Micromonospora sp. LH3U1]|uniref:WhiB family transcriptional regulator n=1 Tax=Micromonospora sp. LH3U1 TaxID=3018339 RepID=UPI00234A904E|nr:WhiB family transcriptional regulator [Micromonospora sp. LH3U1]WCN80035.1 WhiB family transcriptional regulator [Micromonospora sp. LH3U1]
MTNQQGKDPADVWYQPGRLLPKFVGRAGQACKETDPSLFFRAAKEHAAKAICNTTPCRWRAECLQFVLVMSPDRDRHGVWGGTTPAERYLIRQGKIQPGDAWSGAVAQDELDSALRNAEIEVHSNPGQSSSPRFDKSERAAQVRLCAELRQQGLSVAAISGKLDLNYRLVLVRLQAAKEAQQAPTAQPQ